MKQIIKYLIITILAVVMLGGAAVAFAAQGGEGGPCGPGGPGRGQGGEVTSIEDSTIHVENPRGEATILTNDETEFVVNGEAGSLSEIQVGMFVHAQGETNDDGNFTASRVFASDEAPPPPQHDGQGQRPGPGGQQGPNGQ